MTEQADWARLLKIACAMIRQINSERQFIDDWTLGGGTAMMLQIDHRESRDIDIFLPDAQYLSFLDPQKRDFDFDIRPIDYRGDGISLLKLGFEMGEIDFIVAPALTSSPTVKGSIEGEAILLETIPEIITKKIHHRGTNITPRDIFDIAAASEAHAGAIIKELENHRAEVAGTLLAMEKQNPDFVQTAIAQLQIKDRYRAIANTAMERARKLLRAV